MAENVQWIRLKVGMFDGSSFKKIKRAKIGGVSYRDKLTAVWFELLDLAGKSNCDGYLIGSNEIPYQSFEDIATITELKAISQRIQVAKMLKEKRVYTEIAEATGASTATISRVNKCLNYGQGGYDLVLDRINSKGK